jgi:hypothetical protein
MRILPANQMPGNMPNPSIFFTSALTGCSIFVKGPANSPTVYHAGFDSNRDYTANPKQDPNSVRHWQILFDRYSPNTPVRGEANKGQYLSDITTNPDLQVYLNYLKTSAKGNLEIRSLIGEGNVFGLRDAGTGNWTFYLQEVVTCSTGLSRLEKGCWAWALRRRSIARCKTNGDRCVCLSFIRTVRAGRASGIPSR